MSRILKSLSNPLLLESSFLSCQHTPPWHSVLRRTAAAPVQRVAQRDQIQILRVLIITNGEDREMNKHIDNAVFEIMIV